MKLQGIFNWVIKKIEHSVIGVPGLVRHETHHGDGVGLGGEAHKR